MSSKISVIDLFAGPGGLNEGFSSFVNGKGHSPFQTAISIEKESSAHSTLLLRAFYRQFPLGEAPSEYYDFISGRLGRRPEDLLYSLAKFRKQIGRAREEARCLTLGEHDGEIDTALHASMGSNRECIVIGGPPCQAYSLVGRSRRMGDASYVAENDGRNFLYQQYLRIITKCRPVAFVMENVKGMLSAEVGGERVFHRILEDLQRPWGRSKKGGLGYRIYSLAVPSGDNAGILDDPADYVVRMERFGIPQARHRVLLFGIREDVAPRWRPNMLLEQAAELTVRDVIGGLPKLRSGVSRTDDSRDTWRAALSGLKANLAAVRAHAGVGVVEQIRAAIDESLIVPDSRGQNFSPDPVPARIFGSMPRSLRSWYADPSGRGLLCNHESRSHMPGDLQRYLYCSAWAKVAQRNPSSHPFPKPSDYPEALIPAHSNFHSGHFADRFRVQVENRFATTVTSHIAKDGHYFIHYDPAQCRSLTVREAARIQTFPDNYFFVGNRTQQYVQVGNAVPPLLAAKVAQIVATLLSVQ
jgi:DNA (cytosine-5)-methyltransferase 1